MYHGIMNVYKEKGFTSHDVVAKLRGICKQKKIGHTGTLDPDAAGVLPVCLGNGTRLCDMLTDKSKEYVAELKLGVVTDTQDSSGRVLSKQEVSVTGKEAEQVILSFLGESLQTPPMYSALKVNGKRLYELAREGKEIERKARPITIYELEILKSEPPDFTLRVKCSKGTYIRTLCHDIGQALGCGAVMNALLRTKVGEFDLEKAHTLLEIEELSAQGRLSEIITPVDGIFRNLEALCVTENAMKALKNGNQLKMSEVWELTGEKLTGEKPTVPEPDGEYRIYGSQGEFYGIYRYDGERRLLSPVKMFIPE